MTNSKFCIQQRQKERQRINKLLIAGFASSAILHGIIAYVLPKWSFDSPQQAEEPMEMILVDKPKPEPKPEPKIESKPIVEPKPKPVKPPEPVQAKTPPPPVKPPEPVKAQTAPPKPVPKKVLTTPTPAPSQPIVSAPIENTTQAPTLNSSFSAPTSAITSTTSSTSSNPGTPGSTAVAANSAPPRPEANNSSEGISCVSNCEPEYPASLEGSEGDAGVKLTIDPNGNVVGAELVEPHSNSLVNRQALLAARQMQFSPPGNSSVAVRVNIDFTVEGSEYDRLAREEREKRERAEREKQELEAARQQQLEAEKQARQEQLERERQARQQELQQPEIQPEPTPSPVETKPEPKPLPTLSPEELEAERLRKFKERMEQYQN